MTLLRAVAANRTTEPGRLGGAARPDEHAGNASFPEALNSAASAEELSQHSKSRSDPEFETSSAETRSEHSGSQTRLSQGADNEPLRNATHQTSLGDHDLTVDGAVAARTAGNANSDEFKPGSDRPSNGPDANAPSMPQGEIGDHSTRRHQIRRSGQETGAADAAFASTIIHAPEPQPTRQVTGGWAIEGERNAPTAVSLPTPVVPSLELSDGGTGWVPPRDGSAERASSISGQETGTADAAFAVVISHATGGRLTRQFTSGSATDGERNVPAAVSLPTSGIHSLGLPDGEPGRAPLRDGSAERASTTPFSPSQDGATKDAAMTVAVQLATSPGTDAVGSVLSETSASSPASASSEVDPGPDFLRRFPAIGASSALKVVIGAADPSAEHTSEDPRTVSSARLMAGAPNPLAGNTDLAGLPVEGSAPSSSSNPQPPGLAEQLVHHVITSIDNGGREVVLQLHPPELGELTVRVLVSGRDVSAWFGSQQIQVQQAINQAIGQLHADLGNAGYNLNGAWVGADASGSREWDGRPLAPPPRGTADKSSSQGSPALSTPSAPSGVSIYV